MADNIGNFNSSANGVAAVTAVATGTGPGSNGVHARTASTVDSAVYGEHDGSGIGVFGRGGSQSGEGVFGQTASGSSGVYGKNTTNTPNTRDHPYVAGVNPGATGESTGTGVVGTSNLAGIPDLVDLLGIPGGIGVLGRNNQLRGTGVQGEGAGIGVNGISDSGTGVSGSSSSGTGVEGVSASGTGVSGSSSGFSGVSGTNLNGFGVAGVGRGAGVYARNTGAIANEAYLGAGSFAGDFHGDVAVSGHLSKPGGGFRIDDPRDPARKYLSHSFVESSDMKNIYDGVTVMGDNGETVIELPDWLESLNVSFRYQLTPIGAAGPDLYIAEEVANNQFKIAGGVSGMKVSWQLTGIRQDPWANAYRVQVEEEKPVEEMGCYLHPDLYSQPPETHVKHQRYCVNIHP